MAVNRGRPGTPGSNNRKLKPIWIVMAGLVAVVFIIVGIAGSHDKNQSVSAQGVATPHLAAAPTALAGEDASQAATQQPAASSEATSPAAAPPSAATSSVAVRVQATTRRSATSRASATKAASAQKSAPKAQQTHAAGPSPVAAPAECEPKTNGGNCYEPGEFCRKTDHGVSGVAGDGKKIVCQDNDGWRWEPA
jgi:hypothetical protein